MVIARLISQNGNMVVTVDETRNGHAAPEVEDSRSPEEQFGGVTTAISHVHNAPVIDTDYRDNWTPAVHGEDGAIFENQRAPQRALCVGGRDAGSLVGAVAE